MHTSIRQRHLIHSSTLLLCCSLAACASSSESEREKAADPYADLFGEPDPSANETSVFGTWGTSFSQPDLDVETVVRMRLDPGQIKLAARCSSSSKTVTAGVTAPATVSPSQAIVKQAAESEESLGGNVGCHAGLTAGTVPLAIGGDGLSFGGSLLLEQKVSD